MATAEISSFNTAITPQISFNNNSSSSEQKTAIQDLMHQSLFKKDIDETSPHDRATKLPYFTRLHNSTLPIHSFLLNLVNNASIYKKIETFIKVDDAFKKILHPDLHRYYPLLRDINFLTSNLDIVRPEETPEALNTLKFIEEIGSKNPRLLVAVIYVLYSGLFIGRLEYQSSTLLLKKTISNWETFPEDNRGVSFWSFREVAAQNNAIEIKKEFLKELNEYGNQLTTEECDQLPIIAKQTFDHILKSIESTASKEPIKAKKIVFFEESNLSRTQQKAIRIFVLVVLVGIIIQALNQR